MKRFLAEALETAAEDPEAFVTEIKKSLGKLRDNADQLAGAYRQDPIAVRRHLSKRVVSGVARAIKRELQDD